MMTMTTDRTTLPVVIGLDPGTSKMGVSVWLAPTQAGEEPGLLACFPLVAPRTPQGMSAPYRMVWMLETLGARLDALGLPAGTPEVTVAAEHLKGASVPLSPALDAMITALRQFSQARGWAWVEYSPSQWRRVVYLHRASAHTKGEIRDRMELRYPELKALKGQEGQLDAIEAAGVGLYHASQVPLLMQAARVAATRGRGRRG